MCDKVHAEIAALAHRLLGAARTIGAPALSRDAEALQNAARSGTVDPDQAARVLAASRAVIEALALRSEEAGAEAA